MDTLNMGTLMLAVVIIVWGLLSLTGTKDDDDGNDSFPGTMGGATG